MNKIKIILCIFIPLLVFVTESCDQKTDNGMTDFLKDLDRIGFWVNQERKDTLEFKNNDLLIRHYGNSSEFNYSIVNSTLFLKLPNSETRTQHRITDIGNAKVTIHNMYIGTEETYNSGVFFKDPVIQSKIKSLRKTPIIMKISPATGYR